MLAFAGYTALYVAYQAVSLPVNFAGHSFNLAAHQALYQERGTRVRYPSVDIFLPICAWSIGVLHNTWSGAF